ncbi:MAG: protein kinase, partial [Planctomycetota bacterium]|nr:protein kinase [Planctomycetota bacterium]
MDINQEQAQRIQQLGLVAPNHLQRALQLVQPNKDLCAVLCEQGILSAEMVPQIRSTPSLGPLHQGTIRNQAAQALASISVNDPHFAPHINHVLERREELGRGGMGVVYRVFDKRLKREAALKILHAGLSDPDSHLRFQREAEVMAQLDHPAIPPVYEMGMTPQGESFMLMKVVEGVTLKQRIHKFQFTNSKAPELTELLMCLVKVSEAMAFAHSKGFLHRDLKPSNIMIGEFGEVQVMDWGLCRKIGQGESHLTKASLTLDSSEANTLGLTKEGAVLGTPGYMPPEQISGDKVDERADVFAFGAILTELLTGRPPVQGRTPLDCLIATMHSEIATPRQRNAAIPIELDSIAANCLETDRDERTSSMDDIGRQLLSFIGNKEQGASKARILGVGGLLFVGSLVVLALSTLMFFLAALELESKTERRRGAPEKLTEKNEPSEAPGAPEKISYIERALKLLKERPDLKKLELELNKYDKDVQSPRDLIECSEFCERLRRGDCQQAFLLRAERLFPKSNMVLFKIKSIPKRAFNATFFNSARDILNGGTEDEYYFATKAISRLIELRGPRSISRADRGEILALINKAIERNSTDGDLHFVAGRIFDALKEPRRALSYFSKAIKRRPSNGGFYYFRGKVQIELLLNELYNKSLLDRKLLDGAMADAKTALKLDRTLVAAQIIVARGEVMNKNLEGARLAFLKAKQNE